MYTNRRLVAETSRNIPRVIRRTNVLNSPWNFPFISKEVDEIITVKNAVSTKRNLKKKENGSCATIPKKRLVSTFEYEERSITSVKTNPAAATYTV